MSAVATLEVPEIPMAHRDRALNELVERLRRAHPNFSGEEIAGNAETLLLNMLIEAVETHRTFPVGVVVRMVQCFTHIKRGHISGISPETAKAIVAHIRKTT